MAVVLSVGLTRIISLLVLLVLLPHHHDNGVMGQKAASVDFDLDDIMQTIRGDTEGASADMESVMLDLFNQMQQEAEKGDTGQDEETGDTLLSLTNTGGDVSKADTVRSIPADPVGEEVGEQMSFTIRYNASSLHQQEIIQRAEIRAKLPLDKDTLAGDLKNYRLRVIIRHGGRKVSREKHRLSVVGFTADNFAIIDVTDVIRSVPTGLNASTTVQFVVVRKKNASQHHITRRSTASNTTNLNSTSVKLFKEISHAKAFLLVFSKSSTPETLFSSLPSSALIDTDLLQLQRNFSKSDEFSRSRSKRKKFKETLCERVPMILNFKFLGWDKWVLYPKIANLYACRGRCPNRIPPDLMPSNHAILQNLMRGRNRTINAACCSPIDLSPLSIMYQEKKEIVVRHHENMVVERCGCR